MADNDFSWKDIGIGLLSMKAPSIAKGYYAAQDRQHNAEQAEQLGLLADQVYGQRGREFSQTDMDMGGGAQRSIIQEPQQGRGYLDQVEPGSAEEKYANFNKGLMESGNPLLQKQWMANNQQMQSRGLEPEKPFTPAMHLVGVEGRPDWQQQAYLDQKGQQQNFGLPRKARSGVNIDMRGGIKAPANYMVAEDGKSVVPIPGSPSDPKGVANVQKETKEYNAANSVYKPLFDNIDRFTRLIEQHGTELIPGEAQRSLRAVRTNLLMQMKEYYELGAITGPDMELMNSLIPDPTELSSAVVPNKAMIGGLEEVKSMLRKTRQGLGTKFPNAERDPVAGDTRINPETGEHEVWED